MRIVKLADNAGFCFGVQRAVEEALKIQKEYNRKIYTLGPLIHNNDVVNFLEENNIYAIGLDNLDNLIKEDVIVIRSHGVGKDTIKELENRELIVINATCPFVTNIQRKVQKFSEQGYGIVILGDEKHPEVIGINGWCNNDAIITKDGSLPTDLPKKICAVSQTTEKKENWDKTVSNLNGKSEDILTYNTICLATEERQRSAEKISKEVDAMIVVGGKNSSNTTKLYQIAKANCSNTIHVENSSEIPEEYIKNNKFKKIGITAGASTPDWIIREVINIMQDTTNNNDEQLQLMDEMDKRFRIGDEVEGEILSKTRDEIIVSLVGYKSDGVIPFRELTAMCEPQEMAEKLNIGENIKAKVIKLQNNDGYVVLSRLEYEKKEAYDELEKLFNESTIFDVKIDEVKEKGLVSYFKGARIFIPASQIDVKFINNKEELKGQTLQVKLIELSLGRNSKIIASRRVILEKEIAEKEEKAWSSFNVGDIVKGEVKRFAKFGAFVDVNGVDGLLHLSQISWKHINKAEDALNVGDIIDVKIIELDKESKKLSLSVKQLTQEPWANATEKYPEGSVVLGKVARINDFGAFVELEPGLDGLVHISKISHDRVEHPSQVLTVGEEIKAVILSVDQENKRISLSMKDV
ncbi:bifunctional 4-hydroxy-3-methylbut-2-enyl diphosphate reductase/30S ribosomal protein S1 [Clostridium sp. SHJSY1]|uniref:bifunctional 4-hydroxy-3-methylbut-2-enyl diphosphate reductase/30S ribosomal protein S1 n=1 Tax=Clostridium sp. SHJSY1 TaxID=2942483 RepID=UPI0028769F1C|nr:bifunctional 4-hydroxy-3-methylbut-2-enyl diphosphate reductase/30S ribosomal protein S1 [Clostridium sp. SHJSY1]MDS0524537.1 bifunctional 4-hydroxy-3-methylbut-2-enyl diphosphate reductase/30S ribosomal protein S1 [Clostridium sp. SHJSY1]